jgi:hypothetical protein
MWQNSVQEVEGALYDPGIVHALIKPTGLDIQRIDVSGACFLWLKTVPEKEKMLTTLPGLLIICLVPFFHLIDPSNNPPFQSVYIETALTFVQYKG